ncbi:MAG: site-specific integrase [Candidatus Blackburnbacteria bacterium]|nr:site-specific integrase [Candidatus Blackburnbacteria bacterium]
MSITAQFEQYLLTKKHVSRKTLRNYRCDLAHFANFALIQTSTNNVEELLPHFNNRLVKKYKAGQTTEGVQTSTINRRLSTLRNFSQFLLGLGLITSNPTTVIKNAQKPIPEDKLEKMLAEFRRHLEKQGVSKSTLKNYLSDVNQFFEYALVQSK